MASFNRRKEILLLLVIPLTTRGSETVFEADLRYPVVMYQNTGWSSIRHHSLFAFCALRLKQM